MTVGQPVAAGTTPPANSHKFVQIADASTAVGTAARFMMGEPAYAKLSFADWARVLDGQARRGHYGFVLDSAERVVGFAGWALAAQADAEAWADEGKPLADEECRAGDCMIFNAWIARGKEAHRFLLDAMRPFFADKRTLYFRRSYPDGTTRVVRLPVTNAVGGHIARRTDADRVGARPNESIENELSKEYEHE